MARKQAAPKVTEQIPAQVSEEVKVPDLDLGIINITIRGTTSLICHKFGEKAQKMMRDKQQGAARQKKPAKDQQEDFLGSLYELPDQPGSYGFPASAFKNAAISACRYVEGLPMTRAKGAFHVLGDILPIAGSPPTMREDVVRLNSGPRPVADLRYRGEFKTWSVTLMIRYNRRAITPSQLINLFRVAGFAVGVGEWRPERNGSHGMFDVAHDLQPVEGLN